MAANTAASPAAPGAAANVGVGSGHADRHFEEIVAQSQNFEHFEKIFQQAIVDIESDDALETFRHEYEELHSSFLKCHEGEKRLIKKCQDLAAEISSCVMKVKAAEELSQGDQNTIDQLKKEIDKARSKISQSKETEVTLKERIKQLKSEIKDLDAQLKKGPASIVGQDTSLAELSRVKIDLQKESDTQDAQLNAIRHDIDYVQGRVESVANEKRKKEDEVKKLHTAIGEKQEEINAHNERMASSDARFKELQTLLAKRKTEHTNVEAQYRNLHATNASLDETVTERKGDNERVAKEKQQLEKDLHRKRIEYSDSLEKKRVLEKEREEFQQRLRIKDNELVALAKEHQKQAKLCDGIDKRNILLETDVRESKATHEKLLMDVRSMEDDIACIQREAEMDRKQLEDLTRERDILNKNYLKAQSATQRQKDWLTVKKNQLRNLEHQLKGYERHAHKQREVIAQLDREAKTYEEDAERNAREYIEVLEKIREKEEQVIGKQKDIQDLESKLRVQQTNLDTVLNERNLYAKNALQLKQEINEKKRKFQGMHNVIFNLKRQIASKENELKEEDRDVSKLIQEKEEHTTGIENHKKITEKREKTIERYNEELHKLNQIIAEAATEKAKQRRDHVNVLNERDILGAQLIKRNDELAKLYEQIRIQQSTLRKGEAQYNDRLREMQHLNFRVQQLRQELRGMRQFASRLPELKLGVNKAYKELTREECRVRTLLDECDNPRNVHRYRQLEGSEPQTQQLFQRVKELQEELLLKSSEVEEKDRLIEEKERLYKELREIIARQPGPEVAEQLNVYQDSLQKKSGQLRAMKDSLNHFQDQVKHYQARFDELKEDLRDLNNAYVQSRKEEERDLRRRAQINEMMGRPADAPLDGDQQDEYTGYTAPPRPQTSEAAPVDTMLPTAPHSDPQAGSGDVPTEYTAELSTGEEQPGVPEPFEDEQGHRGDADEPADEPGDM